MRSSAPAARARRQPTTWPGSGLEIDPIDVGGTAVVPRDLLHAVLEPKIRAKPGEPDLVIVRVLAKGRRDGNPAHVLLELVDRFDEATGFTAMERTTGGTARSRRS